MKDLIDSLQGIKILGYGSSIGAAIGGITYCLFSDVLPQVDIENLMLIGGLLGGGIAKLLQAIFQRLEKVKSNRLDLYFSIARIVVLNRVFKLDYSDEIINILIHKYHLGDEFLNILKKYISLPKTDVIEQGVPTKGLDPSLINKGEFSPNPEEVHPENETASSSKSSDSI